MGLKTERKVKWGMAEKLIIHEDFETWKKMIEGQMKTEVVGTRSSHLLLRYRGWANFKIFFFVKIIFIYVFILFCCVDIKNNFKK